jgi:hypothetical protein
MVVYIIIMDIERKLRFIQLSSLVINPRLPRRKEDDSQKSRETMRVLSSETTERRWKTRGIMGIIRD